MVYGREVGTSDFGIDLEDNSNLVTLIPSEDLASSSKGTVLHQQFLRNMLDNFPMFFVVCRLLGSKIVFQCVYLLP